MPSGWSYAPYSPTKRTAFVDANTCLERSLGNPRQQLPVASVDDGGGLITDEAQPFHGWLMQNEGSAVERVDEEVRRLTSGSEHAGTHPGAAHHLCEAFELLWGGHTSDQVVSEVGDHLRKALMDTTTDVVGHTTAGKQEKPIDRLRSHLEELNLPSREADVLSRIVELAMAVLHL